MREGGGKGRQNGYLKSGKDLFGHQIPTLCLTISTTLIGATTMKAVIFAAVVAVAVAANLPGDLNSTPVPIVRQQQVNPVSGAHNFEFESANGITFTESGSEGVQGGANRIGSFSFPMEDGSLATVNFVADENGFQPDSHLLPVAPEFPHPIPQFVLDQIEFARIEDEQKAREGKKTV